jgi:DNA mismatch endonuclease (patch repair protein)
MADVVDPVTRSRMMSGIGSAHTKPELVLRRALHRAGLRFRLHARNLPGRPDVVLPRHRVAILVHGCFWHRHSGCHWCSTPGSNQHFWTEKFAGNVERDLRTRHELRAAGWRVAVVWECALRADYFEATVARLIEWIRSDVDSFETEVLRANRNRVSSLGEDIRVP